MATNFDHLKDVSVHSLSEDKVWKIKVRILRLWKVYFGSNNNIPMIEMVVIDEKVPLIENNNESLMLTQNSNCQEISKESHSQISETKAVDESSDFITPAKSEEKHITCSSLDDPLHDDNLTPSKSREKDKLKKNPTEFYVDDKVADVKIADKKDGVAFCPEQSSKEYNLFSTKIRNVKRKIKEKN
ncbi:hypothetical protein PIB30_024776 [Stylosanthes scabra]|uniref:Uncharacterized protein n=1 Tax=Stylosanthes scabra TaxID=79078 RepID=A0ABU6V9P7_9FABA|nr:hypothetical protein [Stylosanthes scabra]